LSGSIANNACFEEKKWMFCLPIENFQMAQFGGQYILNIHPVII